MEEIKPTPGGQTITGNSKEDAALTASDIQLIKNRFKKNKKILWYIIIVLFFIGFAISAVAILNEVMEVNRLNSKGRVVDGTLMVFSVNYWEGLIPFGAGTGISLFFLFGIVATNQEQKAILRDDKIIYKGIVSGRKETGSRRQDLGGRTESYYSYTVHLGDIYFTHEDLYHELDEGDTIEIHLRGYIVLYKNIIKNKKVADLKPEVIADYGFAKLVIPKQKAEEKADYLTDEEMTALKKQKHRRLIRILPVAIVFVLGLGITCEINLWIDHYTWDESLGMRLGLWGGPLVFFGLIALRRLEPLSKDIKSGQKKIIFEKLMSKNERLWASSGEMSYYLHGLTGESEVSRIFYDSLSPGDDFLLHKTLARNKLLMAVNTKTNLTFYNPEIFKFDNK
jgi:hypothetical protein